MTISSTTSKNTYVGDGVTTSFSFTFRVLDETHFTVEIKDVNDVITTKVITADYNVSGSGNDAGRTNYTSGNINFLVAPLSTDTVTIKRNVPLLQQTDYTENDAFPAESHEEALDELTMISQQLDEDGQRSLKLASDISGIDLTIPAITANQYIKLNSAGDGFEAVTLSATAGLGSVVEDPSPQLGGDLDCNSYDIQMDDATGIRDDSDNEQLIFQSTASAVNHFEITNSATGTSPLLKSVGDDANVDMRIASQGAGNVRLEGTVVIPDEIQHDGDSDNKIGFTADTQTFTTGGSTRMDITDSGVQLGGANARVTTILDEDAMGSNSDTALATQQSIKAYVETRTAERVKQAIDSLAGGGSLLQFVSTSNGGSGSTTSLVPNDNTIPQSSEGTQWDQIVVTPTSATSNLLIEFNCFVGANANSTAVTVSLFEPSASSNAICSTQAATTSIQTGANVVLTAVVSSTGTSARTFTVRYGTGSTGGDPTVHMNRVGLGTRFSTTTKSVIKVMEIE